MTRSSQLTIAALSAAAALAATCAPALGAAPSAVTGAAQEVTTTTATLTGKVGSSGAATRWAFQYGTRSDLASETAARTTSAASESASAKVEGLRPGTEYHYRLLAASESGTAAGQILSFKTAGVAPPAVPPPAVTTGSTTVTGPHEANLTGTVGPLSSRAFYYFEFGKKVPYEYATFPQPLPASAAPVSVLAPLAGLQGGESFHDRLVVAYGEGELAAGADQTFATPAVSRVAPAAVESVAQPARQTRLPATLTVSGRVVPPAGVEGPHACEGFVQINFRVGHAISIQSLRAGLHNDCTFSLRVRFSERRRLRGGRVTVEVVFPGNQLLHRRAAPLRTVQIG